MTCYTCGKPGHTSRIYRESQGKPYGGNNRINRGNKFSLALQLKITQFTNSPVLLVPSGSKSHSLTNQKIRKTADPFFKEISGTSGLGKVPRNFLLTGIKMN
ncbi:hypothetical protein RhiirA1_450930 [Rhizophagus irregularis]|uniref:CCHC-type domain-containing protein n=1 Tax=Rhizophagus irregularis TaxID=588596 RepID=A0A2N0SDQ3_9GLOM|nr:hypothetical protein RhiirA1_450930 [Rhizophagus irregularis]